VSRFKRRPEDRKCGAGTDWRGDCEGDGQSGEPAGKTQRTASRVAERDRVGARRSVKYVVDIATRR